MTKTSKPKLHNLSGKRWFLYASKEGLTVHHQIYIDGQFIRKDSHKIPWDFLDTLKEKYTN